MDANHDAQVLKKVYFIKRPREGEELVTLLKNKFKTIDAIRDVLGWFREGREFTVDLRTVPGPGEDGLDHVKFDVTRFTANAENNRSILGAIGYILSWLDDERVFDITLIPRDGSGAGPLGATLN
jgi:hypothetical protein